MKRRTYLFPLMAVTALSLTLAACDDNGADEPAVVEQTTSTAPAITPPSPVVDALNATAYATAEGATTGAVFVTLTNPNPEADKLTGAKTDKAPTVELHQSYVDEADGTMQMRKVDSIDIPAGQSVALEPGGYHIMLMGLTAPLVEGETFTVTLMLENGGEVAVPVMITAPGAAAATTTDGTTTTYTTPEAHDTTDGHVHDDGAAVAPSTTTDVPVTEDTTTTTPATPATTEEVPADAPVTDAPAADEQPAQ